MAIGIVVALIWGILPRRPDAPTGPSDWDTALTQVKAKTGSDIDFEQTATLPSADSRFSLAVHAFDGLCLVNMTTTERLKDLEMKVLGNEVATGMAQLYSAHRALHDEGRDVRVEVFFNERRIATSRTVNGRLQ